MKQNVTAAWGMHRNVTAAGRMKHVTASWGIKRNLTQGVKHNVTAAWGMKHYEAAARGGEANGDRHLGKQSTWKAKDGLIAAWGG